MDFRTLSTSALVGISSVLISSCASGPQARTAPAPDLGPMAPRSSAPGSIASTASATEQQEYKEIFALYSGGKYDAAIQRIQSFGRRYPQSPLTSQVENLRGMSYLLTKHPSEAVPYFRRALEESGSNPSMGHYLAYNLADAQFESGQVDEAAKTASTLDPSKMDKDNRIKARYLRARIHAQKSSPVEAARECLAAGKDFPPGSARETREAVTALLDQSLKSIGDVSALEELYRSNEDSVLADAVLFRLGSALTAAGNPEKARGPLKNLTTRYPESPYYAQAMELLRDSKEPSSEETAGSASQAASASRDTGPVDSRAVGVLLPMKGKFAKFGARSLQGIELALRIFNGQEPDSKLTIVVEDSGEDAETAVRALDKLVTQHHVVGVIGPLLSKGVDQVSSRAETLGVPLISLSRHQGTPSDYVFQAGLTLRMQAREIARYAIEKLGIKRFAVVFPRDKVGEESMQRFWDAVEALGGTIRGVESYNPGETDFRQAVDRLSGLYYSEARSRELEQLAREREINKIRRRTRKTEQYYSLQPVVDYEAVFIPEEPKAAGQLMPTFAYRDVEHVKFLGTSAWNSPELPERAASYAENAFFLDAFFPESQSPAARKYVERYKATFDQEPTSMDALAYDAARVLESILAKHDAIGRQELKDKLKEVREFPGVTGRITYQDGQFSRDLKILTVKGGKIVEPPAPAQVSAR